MIKKLKSWFNDMTVRRVNLMKITPQVKRFLNGTALSPTIPNTTIYFGGNDE